MAFVPCAPSRSVGCRLPAATPAAACSGRPLRQSLPVGRPATARGRPAAGALRSPPTMQHAADSSAAPATTTLPGASTTTLWVDASAAAITQDSPDAEVAVALAAEHRLTVGERARTVVHVCRTGTLSTSSVKHGGVPFGSHVDYVLDGAGRPVMLLAVDAAHSKNLVESNMVSLYAQPQESSGQGGCRATLVGRLAPLAAADGVDGADEEEVAELVEAYTERHPHAAKALTYPDRFNFFRMSVEDVYFVGGFGVTATWVAVEDYSNASADPLAFDAPSMVSTTNKRQQKELRSMCRVFLGVDDAETVTMMALDRLGVDLRVVTTSGATSEFRVAFREKVACRFDAQSALVKALQESWEKENGFGDAWEEETPRVVVKYYGRA
ncbi:hypothetical protein BU14_1393s0002 [Porphyra umbilicalis]|uniref:Uncharacterized protein n=1 Tax=Porphyra umbilicalis TaxID=2786 RepID=A0A1X6NLX2_PORUM|nr:hypothetical protein BU14_1393s0002 [Porphyra umbilicalis]|eukprot:OSX69562.1 hypothetical protein BU14_1393s0002 [Porphyra umbilicalis]